MYGMRISCKRCNAIVLHSFLQNLDKKFVEIHRILAKMNKHLVYADLTLYAQILSNFSLLNYLYAFLS